MNDNLTLVEENLTLRNKLIEQMQENLELKQRLLAEIQDSIRILNEKGVILDKSIKKGQEMIKILDILKIALEAMDKARKNMGVLDPNREILTDAFAEIMKKQLEINE
jgi:hypothetical protein